ncbi:MAG: multidrug effflux MFS transporter [Alphaproteobacteria bacterium]|nr:multidrug effflux MFS transporter [Alphaproteobacteria bacterium]
MTQLRTAKGPPLLLLVALTAVPSLSTNIFIPSMPGLVEYFATDGATVQLTLTVYLLTLGVGQLLYGPLSDRFGRRPVLLAGLVVYVVGTALCLAAPSIGFLVLARVVQAAGGCAGVMVGRAMIRDTYGRDKAASMLGYITMTMAMATAVAPVTGAFLEEWHGWRASFLLMTVMGMLVAFFSWRLAGETLAVRMPLPSLLPMLALYATALQSPRFRRFGGYSVCTISSYYAFVAGAPYVVIGLYGQPPSTFGLYYMLAGASYITGNFLAGRLTERAGIETMTWIGGAIIAACGCTLIALTAADIRHPAAVFLPVAVSFIGSGLSQPSAMIGAIEALPRNIGACAGLLGALQLAAGSLASLVIGVTQPYGALPFALVCGGLLVAALASLMLPMERERRAPP